jgi:transposase
VVRLEIVGYKPHPPVERLLIGYDPLDVVCDDHLAKLIDKVVEEVAPPDPRSLFGQRAYSPQMLAKILLYGYATGTFSSRRLAQNCVEHLAYLYLSRGQRPCFKTLASARVNLKEYLERVWLTLLATCACEGLACVGKIAVDASRFKANTSRDLVVADAEYDKLLARLDELLVRAREVDSFEDREGEAVNTRTKVDVSRITVRQVVRSLGKEAPQGSLSARGSKRLQECRQAVEEAQREGRAHVSLSDPDARMMPIGSGRRVSMGHALEVAVDSGVIVAGSTNNHATDSGHLLPMVFEACQNDPAPVSEVAADSAYFLAEDVVELEDAGIEAVVPDSATAGKMRRGEPIAKEQTVSFTPVQGKDAFLCPMGNELRLCDLRAKGGARKYRAARPCTGCPLAQVCLQKPGTKRRTLSVRPHNDRISKYLSRFDDPQVCTRYHARGPCVETVFAFLRRVLGFAQWSVRGATKIASEGELLKCTYQVRKLHRLRLTI